MGLSFLHAGDDQILPEHWWWAGLAAREQRGFVNRKGCECVEHAGNASSSKPTVKWRREQETASPDHKKGKEKSSFSAFSFVPLCLKHHFWFTLKRRAGLMIPECKVFLQDTIHYLCCVSTNNPVERSFTCALMLMPCTPAFSCIPLHQELWGEN